MISVQALWLMPALGLLALLLRVQRCRHAAGHWKIAAFDGCRDALLGGLLFAIAGPPLGLLLTLLPSLLASLRDQGTSLLGAVVMLPVLGLVFGLPPALACGVVAGALKPWLPRWTGTLLCALLGAALASLWFAAMDFAHTLRALWAPAVSGALGGGVIAAGYLRHNGFASLRLHYPARSTPMHNHTGITRVGDTVIQPRHRASCHCGAVQLALHLPDGIVDPRRCDCSYCRRRGTVVASVLLDDIQIVAGHDALQLYQFNTGTARHYFCRHCGIHTHHQRRSNPQQYGVNVGCLEGINPYQLGPVPTRDGIDHPADRQPNSSP